MIKSFNIPGLEVMNGNLVRNNENYFMDYKVYHFSDGMEYVEERELDKIPSGDNWIRMVRDIRKP